MTLPFWLVAVLFHAGFLTACSVVAWRRLSCGGPSPPRLALLGLDGLVLVLTAAAFAGVGSLAVSPVSGFTLLRLASQALFGEGFVFALIVGGVLVRRGGDGAGCGRALLASAGVLLAVYVEAYHREPWDFQVRHLSVDLSKGPPRGRLRLLHLSDIQTHRVRRYEEDVLRRALELRPDLIVLTGDYVQPRPGGSRDRITAELNALLRRLSFEAPLGAFAVRGDVDRDWPAVFAGTGVRPLSAEVVRLDLAGGRRLSLVALTPALSHGRSPETTRRLARAAPRDDLRVAIGHAPDFVQDLAGAGCLDLALAGHTHGGQVALPFLGSPYTKSRLPRRYASGLHEYGGVVLHVSAGVGMERGTAPQIRFLRPPEMSLLQIRY